MSIYTMAQIVSLTGIKAHTLRKWETRYSFLEPNRTDTNIRYYSDNQLKKLLNISVLTRNGFRISKIDKMSEDEIHREISKNLFDAKIEDEISALVLCMLEMDEVKFDSILRYQIINKGLLSAMVDLIYPFLNQVGVLWGVNKVIPAQEHFVSSLIKQKIFSAIDLLPMPQKDAPSILMFLPEREHHDIGLLLAYYIARELGWKVFYLGQNVPIVNINETIQLTSPKAILTMLITPMKEEHLSNVIDRILDQVNNVPLFVSGNPMIMHNLVNKNIEYLSNPYIFIEELKRLK